MAAVERAQGAARRETFEPALNIYHFIDREGTVLRRNEASRTAIGHLARRSLQLSEYVHPEDTDRMKAELIRLFEREEIRGVKLRFISEERKAFPVELRGTRITDRLAVLEARDRSREDELERRMMETEARYRILIEKAIDTLDSGIIITDQRQEVVWANATTGQFFGIDRDRLIGVDAKRARSRYVGVFDEAQSFSDAVEKAAESGERIDSMTCHVRPSLGRDERVLEYRSIPIETERGRGGRIDHFIDVTELKRLEANLREKTDNLEKSNEKLEEFSHVVSHDLKEPLRTIETFSGFLLEDYADKLDEEGVDYLNTLKRTSARMRQLINDLLSLASIHMDMASFERINTQKVLEEVQEDLEVRLQGREPPGGSRPPARQGQQGPHSRAVQQPDRERDQVQRQGAADGARRVAEGRKERRNGDVLRRGQRDRNRSPLSGTDLRNLREAEPARGRRGHGGRIGDLQAHRGRARRQDLGQLGSWQREHVLLYDPESTRGGIQCITSKR